MLDQSLANNLLNEIKRFEDESPIIMNEKIEGILEN